MLLDNLSLTLTSCFSSLSGLLKFTVSLSKYRFVAAFKHVLRGKIPYGTVKTLGIVMSDEGSYNPPGLFKGQRTQGTDTLFF